MNYKQFKYECDVSWENDRNGHLHAPNFPSIAITAPPEFKGRSDAWTPEHFFVAAVNACYWLTYVGIAEKKGLKLLGFACRGEGFLEFREGGYAFSKIELFPQIEIASELDLSLATEIAANAEKGCLVARSVSCDVLVYPTFSIKHEAEASTQLLPAEVCY